MKQIKVLFNWILNINYIKIIKRHSVASLFLVLMLLIVFLLSLIRIENGKKWSVGYEFLVAAGVKGNLETNYLIDNEKIKGFDENSSYCRDAKPSMPQSSCQNFYVDLNDFKNENEAADFIKTKIEKTCKLENFCKKKQIEIISVKLIKILVKTTKVSLASISNNEINVVREFIYNVRFEKWN